MKFFRYLSYPLLVFLSLIYTVIILIRNLLYDLELIDKSFFNRPIISIGNITSGGTGKTPLVIYLAQLLKKNGMNPGIISRGYGRTSKGLQVVHDGKKIISNVHEAGDEPYLMAKTLIDIPIIVSKNKTEGINKLIDCYFADIIIMDDGFQHRKVNRDLDIVTVSANDNFLHYKLLPLGNLREPKNNIKRADCIIYTKTNNYKIPPIHYHIDCSLNKRFITSTLKLILMKRNDTNYIKTFIPAQSMFAFCGIADHNSFINSIKELDISINGTCFFKDHQNYTESVIKILSKQIKSSESNNVITTEKDFVKLPDSFLLEFNIYIIKINIKFKNESNIYSLITPLFN